MSCLESSRTRFWRDAVQHCFGHPHAGGGERSPQGGGGVAVENDTQVIDLFDLFNRPSIAERIAKRTLARCYRASGGSHARYRYLTLAGAFWPRKKSRRCRHFRRFRHFPHFPHFPHFQLTRVLQRMWRYICEIRYVGKAPLPTHAGWWWWWFVWWRLLVF